MNYATNMTIDMFVLILVSCLDDEVCQIVLGCEQHHQQ
jgi:hypothetical protein